MPRNGIPQKKPSIAQRCVRRLRIPRLVQRAVCFICKKIAPIAGVSLRDFYSRRIFRIKQDLFRTRLRIFQVVRGLGTVLPVNLHHIPGIDRRVEIKKCDGSLNACVRLDFARTRLAKGLKIQDGLRPIHFMFYRPGIRRCLSLNTAFPAFCH